MSGSHTLGYTAEKLAQSYTHTDRAVDKDPDDPKTPLLTPDIKPERAGVNVNGFLYKIREDRVYRKKFVSTFWIWFGCSLFGCVYGQVGTTLPDLQLLLDISLDTASWLFSSFSIGYMIGCLAGGMVIGKVNSFLLLTIYCGVGTILVVVLPWCPSFWLMILVRVFHGFCIGGLDTTCHSELFAIWKLEAAVYVQIMYLSYAVGGFISPLINRPFLAKPIETNQSEATNSSQSTNATPTLGSVYISGTGIEYGETNIYYAYGISGVLSLIASIAFLAEFFKTRNFNRHVSDTHDKDENDMRKKPSRAVFLLAMTIMTLLLMVVTGCIDATGGYMMSFALYQLQWSKDTGALLTSMFWVAFGVGNICCSILVLYLKTGTIIALYLSGSIVAFVGLLFASLYGMTELIWVSLMFVGFSMSALWPAYFMWTEENVTSVSGKVASLFLVSGGIGLILNPLAVGNLMDRYTPMWFVYLFLIETGVQLLLFIIVIVAYKLTAKSYKPIEYKVRRKQRGLSKSTDLF